MSLLDTELECCWDKNSNLLPCTKLDWDSRPIHMFGVQTEPFVKIFCWSLFQQLFVSLSWVQTVRHSLAPVGTPTRSGMNRSDKMLSFVNQFKKTMNACCFLSIMQWSFVILVSQTVIEVKIYKLLNYYWIWSRNGFNHFSDVFSQFTKHIAPAFNHERPERSVQMRSVQETFHSNHIKWYVGCLDIRISSATVLAHVNFSCPWENT